MEKLLFLRTETIAEVRARGFLTKPVYLGCTAISNPNPFAMINPKFVEKSCSGIKVSPTAKLDPSKVTRFLGALCSEVAGINLGVPDSTIHAFGLQQWNKATTTKNNCVAWYIEDTCGNIEAISLVRRADTQTSAISAYEVLAVLATPFATSLNMGHALLQAVLRGAISPKHGAPFVTVMAHPCQKGLIAEMSRYQQCQGLVPKQSQEEGFLQWEGSAQEVMRSLQGTTEWHCYTVDATLQESIIFAEKEPEGHWQVNIGGSYTKEMPCPFLLITDVGFQICVTGRATPQSYHINFRDQG